MTDSIDWGAIPASLASRQQWLLWRLEPHPERPEKMLKVPYWATGTIRNGTQGTDKDRSRLATLENVRRVFERDGDKWTGIGFAFLPGDGLIGIDIDGAIDADTGEIRDRDQVIIECCASYTEKSPSGLGVHIIVEGTTETNKFDPIGLEVFCGSQFFTFTGRRWKSAPAEVTPIDAAVLEGLHKEINDAKEQARIAKELAAELSGKAKPAPRRAPRPAVQGGSRVDDFKRVNDAAMAALDLWVPILFPGAKKTAGKYRITSKQLGRDNEEDLSIDPRGIKDWGVHDMGDARDGARSPVDLVLEWKPEVGNAKGALEWLADRLSIALTPFVPPGGAGRGTGAPAARSRGSGGGGGDRAPDPPGGGAGGPPAEPPAGHPAAGDPEESWNLVRNRRGDPLDCRENVFYALANDPELKGLVAQNMFTELQERTRRAPWNRDAGEWDEEDDLMLGENLLSNYSLMSRALGTLRGGVQMAARLNRYNPVQDLIRREPWDRADRLDTWLVQAFEVEDRPYTRLIGKLFIMGMVKRALSPGCKFDYMLILKGEQGLQKSAAFRALAEPWFTDNAIQMGNKESLMTMQLVWLAESAELESMNRAETTAIKQFLSAQEDLFRPPYGARMVKRPRHAVNVGTTNADTFLKDATGDRRFWPLEVLIVHLDRIRAMRVQLFAEALHRLEAGERYYPTRDEEKALVFPEQERFKMVDPWEDYLAEYVNRTTNPLNDTSGDVNIRRAFFTTRELFDKALSIKADRIDGNKQMETRISNCMKALGFTRYRAPEGVVRPRGYLRPGCEYGKPVPVSMPAAPSGPPGATPQPTESTPSRPPRAAGPTYVPPWKVSGNPGEDDDVPV